jgi:hypothetical protein
MTSSKSTGTKKLVCSLATFRSTVTRLIVVMTTEVFRNMLYGTILGDVSRNLRDVAFVVLDECHYMNDADRGTVWEESIIYAPKDIQLVGLSATVANAQELDDLDRRDPWTDRTGRLGFSAQCHCASTTLVSARSIRCLAPGGAVNSFPQITFWQKETTA